MRFERYKGKDKRKGEKNKDKNDENKFQKKENLQFSNIKERLLRVGFDSEKKLPRSASFLLEDDKLKELEVFSKGNLIIIPIKKAKEKFDFVSSLSFNLIKKDSDSFVSKVAEDDVLGYFIYVKENAKIINPVQTCFFLKSTHYYQKVHNIIVAEKNSEIHIINGCITNINVKQSSHIGITEIYVKENATVSYTMIHDWNENVLVYPRTGIYIEKNGKFISNYIALSAVKHIDTFPTCVVEDNGYCGFFSSIFAKPNSYFDVGSKIILLGKGSKGEIVSRIISKDSKVINRAEIEGIGNNSSGHIECNALILENEKDSKNDSSRNIQKSEISTIPILLAKNPNVSLTHEASLGKIAKDELEYLMARGLSEDESKSVIIKGFLELKIPDLPEIIERDIEILINSLLKEGGF